ncbi:MAG: GxxExxY protein [Planctomycetes bacterium]|nr:GxxExxY protein [Planctomycetota bacterium]
MEALQREPAMLHKELTQQVINAAKAVHAELGAGLPHNFYREAMEIELREVGVAVEVDKPVKITYRGQSLGELGADFCVNDAILCLLVDNEEITPDDYGKSRTLLKSLELDVGLLLKFNGARLDVRRVEAVPAKKQTQATA